MAAALASLLRWQMRQQSALQPAPFNYSLTLSLDCSWQANEAVWQALGRLSQLSSLMIQTAAGDANETAVNMQHLSALAPLGSCLKQLELRITPVGNLQHQDYAFLSSLTTLTGLHLPVECDHVRLDSISCLTNLRSLELPAHRFAELVLDAAVYAAIAQLTQLTRLSLSSIELGSPGCKYLSRLQQLQELSAALCAAALPVVASLTRLTWLEFDWQQQQQQQRPAGVPFTCPSVQALVTARDAVPFESFPGLVDLVQGGSWQPAAFASLAQHCSGLRQLHISSHCSLSASLSVNDMLMPGAAAAAECAAAVRSLSALRQLTWLSFAPKYEAEVAALAALQQLRGLMARITLSSELRLNDLAALGPLRGLTTLAIELPDVIEFSCKRAKRVLSSVPHVQVVTLYVDARHVDAAARVVREAREAHAAAGIEWPAVVLVADLEPRWDA
uniref:Uncharacterized protein n=1 Tax=Tetradesmus obliquus TaxID=3088 RepID=A0A383WEL7_TETOB|eukprot:jgi/Sobl393_1/19325/SZX76047.1